MAAASSIASVGKQQVVTAGRVVIRSFGMATADLRPAPDFLLIGAKRGGSTSFYYDLITHPQVGVLFPRPDRLPKANATKGIHYFDSNYFRGQRWYASHLPSSRVRRLQEQAVGGRVIVGEGSPYYLSHPWAADRVASDLPGVKVIAVLRDPVMRAYSHWKERVRERREDLDFRSAVEQEPERVGDQSTLQALLRDPRAYSYAHEHQSYLEQSRYGASIQRWLTHIPRRQLLLIRSEDYYRDPSGQLNVAADFLGISQDGFRHGAPMNAASGDKIDADSQAFAANLLRDDALLLKALTGITWEWV